MIRALFKFTKLPNLVGGQQPIVIDTTSNSGEYRELSPFILSAPPAKNLENLWQFSKVYRQYADALNNPTPAYYNWRDAGFNDIGAHRYPMGKGSKPLYSIWQGKRLDYIQARKQIYAPEYARNVRATGSFNRLEALHQSCYEQNRELILLDYDAYDHTKLGMSLIDVINNPNRKMGHAFVLVMMLTGMLEECLG